MNVTAMPKMQRTWSYKIVGLGPDLQIWTAHQGACEKSPSI